MISAVPLIIIVYWSLRRIAAAARPTSPALFDGDTTLRSLGTVFVRATSSAAPAFQVAGPLAVTGNVLRISHVDAVPAGNAFATDGTVPVEPGHTMALIAISVSLVGAVAAVVLLVKALTVMAAFWSAAGPARRSDHAPVR